MPLKYSSGVSLLMAANSTMQVDRLPMSNRLAASVSANSFAVMMPFLMRATIKRPLILQSSVAVMPDTAKEKRIWKRAVSTITNRWITETVSATRIQIRIIEKLPTKMEETR